MCHYMGSEFNSDWYLNIYLFIYYFLIIKYSNFLECFAHSCSHKKENLHYSFDDMNLL